MGGGHTGLGIMGWGRPISNEGTYTVVLYIYKYFVVNTVSLHWMRLKIQKQKQAYEEYGEIDGSSSMYIFTPYYNMNPLFRTIYLYYRI